MQTIQAMAVIPFKHSTGPIKSLAKKPKRRKTILTVEPIPKKNRKLGANYKCGIFNGKLVIEGHNFYSDDASTLGIIAFICGVGSVVASTLTSTEPIKIKAYGNFHCDLEVLDAFDERAFLEQFHATLHLCMHSRKQTREFIDAWEKDRFATAVAQVPEALRVHTKLERGVYDESGIPMSAKAIARIARHEKVIEQLENAIQGKFPNLPDVMNIDFNNIIRHGKSAADTDKISYIGTSELVARRLIAHFGFDRLPSTWGELNGMLDYCKHLWMSSGDKFVAKELIIDWQMVGRNIELKLAPWRVPALDAYVANDIEKLRAIHIADRTLERLGIQWKES